MNLSSTPPISENITSENQPTQPPEDIKAFILERRNAFRKACIGITTLSLYLLAPAKAQAENSIHAQVFSSPADAFQVIGLGFGFGRELAENKKHTFHFGVELAGHCELDLQATFGKTKPIFTGTCLGTLGLSFGFQINKNWDIEFVPQAGTGFSFTIPSTGRSFYENGGVKDTSMAFGLETLFMRKINSRWHYCFGVAWSVFTTLEPSVQRETPLSALNQEIHVAPLGFLYEW